MGTGYTRQSAASMIDGQTIFAEDHNDEFNQIESAFSGVSGHSHDGTLGEGPPIDLTTSVTGILPIANGGTNSTSASDARTNLGLGSISTKNSPSVTVDNTIPKFDGTTGDFQNSQVTISDTGILGNLTDGVSPQDAVTVSQFSQIYTIGDFRDTAKVLDSSWLRRDGSLYEINDYPTLASLLPSLPDDITWTSETSSQTMDITSSAYNSGNWFLSGMNSTTGYLITSQDRNSWITHGTAFPNTNQLIINKGPSGSFIGCHLVSNNDSYFLFSVDGTTWTPSLMFNASTDYFFPRDVSYINGLYVAVGALQTENSRNQIVASNNGTTWSTVLLDTTRNGSLRGVAYGNGRYVSVGLSSQIYSTNNISSWTFVTVENTGPLNSIAFGNGIFVAVGNNGTILSSTNSTSWSPRSSETSAHFQKVIFSDGFFLAVGNNGTYSMSSDGIFWTTRTEGSANFSTVCFNPDQPSKYLIGGGSSTIYSGERGFLTLFRVPDDNPTYGWIKAI